MKNILVKQRSTTLLVVELSLALFVFGMAQVLGGGETNPTPKVGIVYVADFDLDIANIKADAGVLPPPPKLPGALGKALPKPPGAPDDPQVVANGLIETMGTSLVNSLKKSGLKSRRLTSAEPVPTSGWLVRGVFTEVNQGNQLQRAVVGFGAGKTDLQVVVQIYDLTQGQRFYELNAKDQSSKMPGAAPMIVLGPAGAAARFVIAGNDLNKNAKQTAGKIAEEVVARTQAPGSGSPK